MQLADFFQVFLLSWDFCQFFFLQMYLYLLYFNLHIAVVVVVPELPPLTVLYSSCLCSERNLRGEGGGDGRRSHPAPAGRGRAHPAGGRRNAHRLWQQRATAHCPQRPGAPLPPEALTSDLLSLNSDLSVVAHSVVMIQWVSSGEQWALGRNRGHWGYFCFKLKQKLIVNTREPCLSPHWWTLYLTDFLK